MPRSADPTAPMSLLCSADDPNHSSVQSDVVVTAARPARHTPRLRQPFFLTRVEAGFPSPASDYVETELDLAEHLIEHEAATYYLRVSGTSMTRAGIHDGDILVVDRAVEPADGDVVVAALDAELTVKRLRTREGRAFLVPESQHHDPIPVRDGQELVVWGVVQHVVHEVS
ncbi:LexA family protein [Salinibacter ruber]|uniref:LexA family protein n=1 Tax=Salinibacter ruber TaxID=146919 RepID=UPI001F07C7BC|nr:translesion error-prone DNA polymerase V autoproteolytic subunit [Salinibacter ruber]